MDARPPSWAGSWPLGQLWNQDPAALGQPPTSALGELLGEVLSVPESMGFLSKSPGNFAGGSGACLIMTCNKKRNQTAVLPNIYLQEKQVIYDTSFYTQ